MLLKDGFTAKNNELGYLLSDKCEYGGRRLYENIVGMFDMNNIDIEIHNNKSKMEVLIIIMIYSSPIYIISDNSAR